MSAQKQKETLGFQAETKQILNLMIHSLYSNKEVFLRELISNASDACDKLRFQALSDDSLYENDKDLKVRVEFDEKARTITITDNGIGMTRDEVIQNIGTIARSGTKEFFQSLTGDKQKDAQLIGQFGVGFYASFIVADNVVLETRKAGADASEAVRWESKGDGEYQIETVNKDARGTSITLHLKKDEDEFLNEFTLRSIIKKFSDHISLPVIMPVTEEKDGKTETKDETINSASALWTLPKSQVKQKDYDEFYKTVCHDFQDPLTQVHSKLEGTLEYSMLLFVPAKAPFDLWTQEHRTGLKLYVKRVFIMDDADKLLPKYLRFVRGVIDSNDLPLNVSREILQENQVVASMRSTATKKVLDAIEDMAKNDKDKFKTFWEEFGRVFKEGVVEDFANKERIAKICRFASTFNDKQEPEVSLDDYIFRMKTGQDSIYYLVADSFEAAKNSPLLEAFRENEVEVLLLSDHVDHWFTTHLQEFNGKKLVSISKGDVDLSWVDGSEKPKDEDAKKDEKVPDVVKRLEEVLKEHVKEVRVSNRLKTSAVCLVSDQQDLDPNLKRLMEQMGQTVPGSKPILEVNVDHALLKKVSEEQNHQVFKDWAQVLLDQAILSDGGQLKDPAGFVKKLNELLV